METTVVSGLDELDKHLDDLLQDPNLALNAKLFDDVELQLTESNIPPLIPRFLPRLTALLKKYADDPTVIVSLTNKLLGPVPFADVRQLASPDELVQAFESPAPAANLLAMAVLHKAAAQPQDVAMLCTMPDVIAAFLHRWLAAPQVEVAHKGNKVLGDLLDIDCELPPPAQPAPRAGQPAGQAPALSIRRAPGQGKLWRLLFADRAMYSLLLDLVAGRHAATAGDAHQLSLAQGRVLRVLPRLASIHFDAVARSDITPPTPVHFTNGGSSSSSGDVAGAEEGADGDGQPRPPRQPPASPRPGEGLLQYAALRMVQKSDRLMHLNLVDFFETLVSLLRVSGLAAAQVETLRGVLHEATAGDEVLREALLSLPDRTVEEEADALRGWLRELFPGEVRLAIR